MVAIKAANKNGRTINEMEKQLHKFEQAGLGTAPFQCVGIEEKTYQACQGAPVQAAGMCDYCGNGIRYCYVINSSDGKRFVVGSECVLKTGDKGLIKQYKTTPEYRALQREKTGAKIRSVEAELAAILAAPPAAVADHVVTVNRYINRQYVKVATPYVEYLNFVLPNCGAAGKAKYLREIKKLIAA